MQGGFSLVSLLALVVGGFAGFAAAQEYPVKTVRVLIPWAAGGSSDAIGRIVTHRLGEVLGQQFVVDNRPGATGTIGHAQVARAAPDGYTILVGSNSTFAIAPHLYRIPYDNEKSLDPVTLLGVSPQMLSLHPSLPAKDLKSFIALAKSRPNELVFSTAGAGATSHLAMELFMYMSGTRMTHVPYKGGGPSAQAVLAGETAMTFMDAITALPFARAGKLRAVAVSTPKRASIMPEVPTMDEAGLKGYDSNTSFGVFVPAGTPRDIVAKLHREFVSALQHPQVRERLVSQGIEVVGSSPDEFRAYQRVESEKWGRVVRERGIKVD
jgi:tripartite-type tricarboxylate transporter receptor subunit TctC